MSEAEQPQNPKDQRGQQGRDGGHRKSNQRPRPKRSDHLERQEVNQNLHRSRYPVFALTEPASMMAHRHFGNAGTYAGRQRWNEAVLFGIEGNPIEQLAAIRLERAPVIRDWYPRKSPDQPVGNPRGHLAKEKLVLPLAPPTADQVVSFLELVDQGGNVARVV